jgi:hypothetical protein
VSDFFCAFWKVNANTGEKEKSMDNLYRLERLNGVGLSEEFRNVLVSLVVEEICILFVQVQVSENNNGKQVT